MTDVALVPIVWIRTLAAAFALAIGGVFFLGRCSVPDPAPLPAKTQALVTRHTIQTVIDSAEIRRLTLEQRRLRAELQEQSVLAVRAEGTAMWARIAADSLRAVVDTARTAADSARAWHGAYDVRTLEADSLASANARKDSALAIAAHERMVADSAHSIMAGRVARSDTVIAELLSLAQRRDRCRMVFGLLQCPTRKQAAVVGLLAGGAIGYAVATKKEINLVLVRIRF